MKNDSQSINDILISFFQSAMTEKNITYRVLAQKMKCSEKTVFTYFNDKKTKRNIIKDKLGDCNGYIRNKKCNI